MRTLRPSGTADSCKGYVSLEYSEMRWKNFGELSTDDRHKVYFIGKEDRHEFGLDFMCIRT